MSTDTRLILSLVNRIAVRLPTTSDTENDSLQHDPLIQQSLSTIASTIMTMLENMSKPNTLPRNDDNSFHLLQSQLFMIRILAACMQHCWKQNQVSQEQSRRRPNLIRTDTDIWELPEGIPPTPNDPPPLDNALAKHIINVMSRYLSQVGTLEDREHGLVANGTRAVAVLEQKHPLCNDIYQAVCRILSYVSASNWNVVFSKFKSRIMCLTSAADESPEVIDIAIIECSSLNSKRLSMILTELCTSTLHLKKTTQQLVAIALRGAIWNWIESYTSEFMMLSRSQKRLEGSPEILFDIFNSLADTAKKKAVYWPVQMMLLILCPDIMLSTTVSGSANNKKSAFLASLRKAMKGDRMADLAAICYVDCCRAATYIAKDDTTALRQIVPDIENELVEKLFDPHRPIGIDGRNNSLGVYIDYQSLMADCIVALFRLDVERTVNTIIPACFEFSAPTLFKVSMVKAAVAIASEENKLPWVPPVSTLHNSLCCRIRALFLEFYSREVREKSDTASQSSRKGMRPRRDTSAIPPERFELILDVLHLYQTDPQFAVLGNDSDRYEQNASLMIAITNYVSDPNPSVREAAADCLIKLHAPNYILSWGPSNHVMEVFWKLSSEVLYTLAKQILTERDKGLRALLDLLRRLLTLRNEFLQQHRNVAARGADTKERRQASIALEVALLVMLCSSDTNICTITIECFALICTEVGLTESFEEYQPSSTIFVENMACYTKLVEDANVVIGRKSQQRRIRRLLRMATHGSPGMLSAWEEAWKRWKLMTPLIVRPPEESRDDTSEVNRKGTGWQDKLRNTSSRHTGSTSTVTTTNRIERLDEERAAEWQNYAGFLAALGGVCLMTAQNEEFLNSQISSSSGTVHSSGIRYVPESAVLVDKFLVEMVDLLACDNLLVREWVREILGNDLSPALYHTMFRCLEDTLTQCFSQANKNEPICEPRYTLFVEQAISVLKLVLDRLTDKSESLFMVDFSTLISLCTFYVNKLTADAGSIKMKIKLCHLIEVLMLKKDRVTIRQEFRLRNKLLEIIAEWISDYTLAKKPYLSTSQLSSNDPSQLEKLQQDLDVACLKTIVALLHQLPLQPVESLQESNAMIAKSKIFFKYFTFFFKILNRCRLSELNSSAQSRSSVEFRTESGIEPLKNYTILALSNLLSANVDAGLKYSFSMGYHEDTSTRTAFMEVLANILNQGTEFENLAETVMTDRYEKLIDILINSDLDVTKSLCEVCPSSEIDDCANALYACYSSKNKIMQLLKTVIQKEIDTTDNETDLFRRTSIATRLLSVFAKDNGAEYVKAVLSPVFQKLSELPRENRCFELDPSKLLPSEDGNRNRQNVIEVTELFLQAICNSVDLAPLSFREICSYIAMSVRERFPEARYTAVGSFIFLRFFCPVIVSPEIDGVTKTAQLNSREMRRGYLIATKVIQNLANNVLFGAKETYMIVLNDFLTNNIYKVANFLREISTMPSEPRNERPTEAYELTEEDYVLLHQVLADNMERISRDLAIRKLNRSHDQESLTSWKREFDRFANILAQLGRPPELRKKESLPSKNYIFAASNQIYSDFIRRNNHRSVESIASKNIFYEGGISKAGRRVYYLILRHIDVDNIDFELLIYHILQILEASSNKSFEVLVDCTLFSNNNEVPSQWINQLMQLLSSDIMGSFAALHVYNSNSYLRTYLKKIEVQQLPHKLSKKTSFTATLSELQEYIQASEIKLPKLTIGLETEPSAVFFPVYKIIQYRANIPLTIKVSAEYIQIMTVRKQEISYGVHAVINDVYHISEVEQVAIVQHEHQGAEQINEFTFKTSRDNVISTFSSPKREAIVNTVRQSKRRYNSSRPTNITERTIRPKDVPGRLLNMALLNLGSDDPNLRLSSYNLLYALSRAFNFDVGKQLLDAKDLCLPSNSTDFIVSISEKIAEKEPGLTLEFLNECIMGYAKSEEGLKYLILLYMMPWLPNLSLYCEGSAKDMAKTKEILRQLIDLTVNGEMTKLVQAKIWKTIVNVDDILELVIETFLQVSNEHGIGSRQAEALADTLVTLSNITIRSKLVMRLRKVLYSTSFKPARSLAEHSAWPEIAILIRFILMLSFNNHGPIKRTVPELFHIVTLVAGTGSTIVRASIHGIVVNLIQSLCTRLPLPAVNIQKLQMILTELSDSKSRLLFGLNRSYANAFAITSETLNDTLEPISLASLEIIVGKLSEVISTAAPNTDIANCWRARWMSLVASTAFQFNPAIQPRAFVVLGYLGREEVDDDLLYQILVALRGALSIFTETDPNLVTSIIMCLKNVVESLPSDSVYLLQLFWVAVALVQINSASIFVAALELLEATFRSLDSNNFFSESNVPEVLLAAREPISDVALQLDRYCGVNFNTHFSFAIAGIIMKGLRFSDAKMAIYSTLCTFLDIERKQYYKNLLGEKNVVIEASTLGYVTALLPIAAKNDSVKQMMKLVGISEVETEPSESTYAGVFDKLDIPDNVTALLVMSLLATMLNATDSESERLFIYGLLSEAAVSLPDVFALIYDSLLPRMNQIVINSQNQLLIESVKSILVTACSNPIFSQPKNRTSQRNLLDQFGFSALGDTTFGVSTSNCLRYAKLASEIMDKIIF
ncbi:hypothetical protein G6F70_005649 [Rhizopus microsporus]|nr:hypothetical protein G6F71_002457 [Rhizopus microsporus]KAG1198618.1 hypothetical protein G6F70_005649 [Rhizopus microsporus]KAG1210452.1 hypothetical protein G6F69_005471 [Rhizopus microsporus]